MTKLENWLERLYETIRLSENKTFKWGQFDCCLFTADCIEAMTGVDYGESYRGRYRTQKGAFKQLLKQTGASTLLEAMTITMERIEGIQEVPAAFMQKGDLAIVELPQSGDSFGVVMNGAIVFPNETGGIKKVNIEPKRVWRII